MNCFGLDAWTIVLYFAIWGLGTGCLGFAVGMARGMR